MFSYVFIDYGDFVTIPWSNLKNTVFKCVADERIYIADQFDKEYIS